jgi:hypothetical protein
MSTELTCPASCVCREHCWYRAWLPKTPIWPAWRPLTSNTISALVLQQACSNGGSQFRTLAFGATLNCRHFFFFGFSCSKCTRIFLLNGLVEFCVRLSKCGHDHLQFHYDPCIWHVWSETKKLDWTGCDQDWTLKTWALVPCSCMRTCGNLCGNLCEASGRLSDCDLQDWEWERHYNCEPFNPGTQCGAKV